MAISHERSPGSPGAKWEVLGPDSGEAVLELYLPIGHPSLLWMPLHDTSSPKV